MIQRLVDENGTRKLDEEKYRRKYTGYADRYAALESRMDGMKKERERRESSTTFSVVSFQGLRKYGSYRWISVKSCSTVWWIMQRCIRTAGWCLPSAMGRKSAKILKAESSRSTGFVPDASGCFFCVFSGERLKRLTASYAPPGFFEARVLLTEVEFSDFPREKVKDTSRIKLFRRGNRRNG